MKRFLILIMLLSWVSVAVAGPFGLDMGTSLAVLEKQMTLTRMAPFKYATASVPQSHADFVAYVFIVTPPYGLCKMTAMTDTIATSVYGEGVMQMFADLEKGLTAKYGRGKHYDFLRSGSLWTEPREWMMGLRAQERQLATVWPAERGKQVPSTLGAIMLSALTDGRNRAHVVLTYESPSYGACADWLKTQKDAPL